MAVRFKVKGGRESVPNTEPSKEKTHASFRDPVKPTENKKLWLPRELNRRKILRYREWIEAERETKGEAAALEAIRQLCRNDLYYLAHEVLEYRDLYEPFHDDMCEFIAHVERGSETSLVLAPRGHFKSTIATIVRAIWWIIRNPNETIGIGSCTLSSAKKFLREIRNHLEAPRLSALFPEIFYQRPQVESPKWTETEILVKRTTKAKEPTIKAFGIEEGVPTGDHYSKILIDDVVDQETVANEDRIIKIRNQLRYVRPLRVTVDQPIHYVGTRYHIMDPYGLMIEEGQCTLYLRKAIEDGKPIFPTRFSLASLEAERVVLGNFIFNCQYLMEPWEESGKKFDLNWLKYHDGLPPKARGYHIVAVCDPANSRKKKSDFTAIGVWAIKWTGECFLIDAVHDKLTPLQRINKVFELHEKWGFQQIAYETLAFQETDVFWMMQEQMRRGAFFEVVEINHHAQSKTDRIWGLQPWLEQGKIIIPRKLLYRRLWENPDDGLGRLVDVIDLIKLQYSCFPNSNTHDDLLDMIQMLKKVYVVPAKPEEDEVVRYGGLVIEKRRRGKKGDPKLR